MYTICTYVNGCTYVVDGVPYEVRAVAATNGGEGEESRLVFFLKELGKFPFIKRLCNNKTQLVPDVRMYIQLF